MVKPATVIRLLTSARQNLLPSYPHSGSNVAEDDLSEQMCWGVKTEEQLKLDLLARLGPVFDPVLIIRLRQAINLEEPLAPPLPSRETSAMDCSLN